MEIILFESRKDLMIAEIISDQTEIQTPGDALDIIGNCGYQGAHAIIMHQRHFSPEFFDLKTGLAGEVLQKFSNYHIRLAIIGNFDNISSKSLKDFIRESNQGKHICFVSNVEQAREKLA